MELILPYTVHFDEQWKRFFFYNTLNHDSVWELPTDIQEKIKNYYEEMKKQKEILSQKVMTDFIPAEKIRQNQLGNHY